MAADPHRYTNPHALLTYELSQRATSGFDVSAVRQQIGPKIDELTDAEAMRWFRTLAVGPPAPDWPYREPSDLAGIGIELPIGPTDLHAPGLPVHDLDGRIAGAWRGRCAGNCLGKPVERGDEWTRATLKTYLQATNNYPINGFVDADGPLPPGMRLVGRTAETCRGHVSYVPRDDDLDYTLLAVHLLETHGTDLTTQDVADAWVTYLPYIAACTAERAAYRNLIMGVPAEHAATKDNPYREWIGALIRADGFGYVWAGDPATAARMAWRDARLSHVGNGIYGAMWAAALVACAFSARSLTDAYDRALLYVPARSRLAEVLSWVRELHRAGGSWESIMDLVDRRFAALPWVHVLNNAAVIATALLTSGEDFTTAIGNTVAAGLDTDSNGATVGSVMGGYLGDAGVPDHWTAHFNDWIHTSLSGSAFSDLTLSGVIARTHSVARSIQRT